jgi:hypothetical protein
MPSTTGVVMCIYNDIMEIVVVHNKIIFTFVWKLKDINLCDEMIMLYVYNENVEQQ